MTFNEWKQTLIGLAKEADILYLVPGNNALFRLWESGKSPKEVFEEIENKRYSYDEGY